MQSHRQRLRDLISNCAKLWISRANCDLCKWYYYRTSICDLLLLKDKNTQVTCNTLCWSICKTRKKRSCTKLSAAKNSLVLCVCQLCYSTAVEFAIHQRLQFIVVDASLKSTVFFCQLCVAFLTDETTSCFCSLFGSAEHVKRFRTVENEVRAAALHIKKPFFFKDTNKAYQTRQ